VNTDSDIKLDQLIQEAIQKNRDAKNRDAPDTVLVHPLDIVIVHPWTTATLNEVSRNTANRYKTEVKYGKDSDDIKQLLILELYKSIHTVKNLKGRPMRDCLKSFLYSIATNLSLNDFRHDKVVKKHEEICASDENTCGVIRSSEGGSHNLQSSKMPAQEQELLDKEQKTLVRAAFQKMLKRFPHEREIMELWRDGKSVKEIVAKTGMSISQVYRAVNKLVTELMREVENSLREKKDAV